MDWFLYVNGLRHERVKCVKEFSRRFDLPNGKSIFLWVFARIVKVTYFAKIINFRKRTHEKIYPRLIKITENLRYFCFVLFCFNATAKQSLLSLYKTKSCATQVYKCVLWNTELRIPAKTNV